ncbi:MAG: hypothetical protein CK520_03340 [Actinobacteria bacterium]|nr:transcriptional repressor [Acidimicrobiia bacterium]PHX59645.1 MAG: hypothetical protein CK520_03340 [Actinomycetota bacterium]
MRTDLTQPAEDRLRGKNQRFTGKRAALVEALAAAGRPLTIPQILELKPALAQSSVYRNLQILERAGVVQRIVTTDEHARFELADELTGNHHHHVVCTVCGNVEDVPAMDGVEASLHAAIDQIDRATGFTTEQHRVDLLGRCRNCAKS